MDVLSFHKDKEGSVTRLQMGITKSIFSLYDGLLSSLEDGLFGLTLNKQYHCISGANRETHSVNSRNRINSHSLVVCKESLVDGERLAMVIKILCIPCQGLFSINLDMNKD